MLSGAKKSIQNLIPKSVPIIEIENPHKMDSISFQSLSRVPYQPPTLELRCLVDAYISPVGGLIARQFSWKNILSIGQSLKDQMEVYPGREIDIALDFTYGTGTVSFYQTDIIRLRPSSSISWIVTYFWYLKLYKVYLYWAYWQFIQGVPSWFITWMTLKWRLRNFWIFRSPTWEIFLFLHQ